MKFKYFSILLICVLTSFVGLGFAGCGDIYENLRVTVDSTSVSLRLPNDTNTGEEDGSTTDGTEDNTTNDDTTETEPQDYPISTTITARVEGASGDMLKSVDFWYEDNSVVSAEVISLVDNVSTIRLTAQGAGSTRIRIISREYSGAVSPDILVTVYRDATDMEFNTSSAPSVAIGGQLV